MDLPIGKVETADEYLDIAFRRAKQRLDEFRPKIGKNKSRVEKSRELELTRINIIKENLIVQLDELIHAFPRTDDLAPFYQELMKATIDFVAFKKALGGLNWAKKKIQFFFKQYNPRIKRVRDVAQVNNVRTQFSGRVSSVIKQIKKELLYLEECRKVIKSYPRIKTGMFTIAIAGFPNVGKSTLLRQITDAKPTVAAYPFTTKKLRLGYYKNKEIGIKMQFIDTPGLLDRPIEKRNAIEKQAILALKHVSHVILFIFDVSESCGYTIKQQLKLLADVKKLFSLDMILVLNKTDLNFEEENYKPLNKFDYIKISASKKTGVEVLVDKLSGLAKDFVKSEGDEYQEEEDKEKKTNAEKKKEKRKRRKERKQFRR